jgi:hypothetical protein
MEPRPVVQPSMQQGLGAGAELGWGGREREQLKVHSHRLADESVTSYGVQLQREGGP